MALDVNISDAATLEVAIADFYVSLSATNGGAVVLEFTAGEIVVELIVTKDRDPANAVLEQAITVARL